MIKIELIDEFAQKIESLIPPALKEAELKRHDKLRELLMHFANEMNLVSREEFDIQSKVLQRTREKLDALEKKLL